MPNEVLISIVTINYNNASGLHNTLESIKNQNFKGFELVVVDGNSTDKSAEVIEQFQSIITKKIIEPDKGIFDAMNKGIAMASGGGWTAFINSGDLLFDENTLTEVSRKLHSKVDCLYGDVLAAYSSGLTHLKKARPLDTFWKSLPFSHQAIYIKTKLIKERNFDLSCRDCSDYDQILDFFMGRKNFDYLEKPLAVIEAGGNSEQNRFKIAKEVKGISRKHFSEPKHKIYYFFYPYTEGLINMLKNVLPKVVVKWITKLKYAVT